jgi:uncharacterized protein (UPF0332 family)
MERLTVEERIALSELRVERAKEMLDDAKKAYEAGMYKTSINRSYYAVLHATRSLLILKGIDPVTHDGAIKLMSLEFVKPGIIQKEMLKILKRLLSLRTDVDYGDMVTVEKEESLEALKDAERFLNEILSIKERYMQELKD